MVLPKSAVLSLPPLPMTAFKTLLSKLAFLVYWHNCQNQWFYGQKQWFYWFFLDRKRGPNTGKPGKVQKCPKIHEKPLKTPILTVFDTLHGVCMGVLDTKISGFLVFLVVYSLHFDHFCRNPHSFTVRNVKTSGDSKKC